jgi:hypothetical protein
MAEKSWNLNWDVPDTPAALKLPLLSAAKHTLAPEKPPQLSVGAEFPQSSLDPIHFYAAPIEFCSIRTPETPFSYSPRKRKHTDDENTPPTLATPAPASKRQKRASPRTPPQKIEAVHLAIKEQNWSFPSFLYHIFRMKDDTGKPVARSAVHAQMVSRFLAGSR